MASACCETLAGVFKRKRERRYCSDHSEVARAVHLMSEHMCRVRLNVNRWSLAHFLLETGKHWQAPQPPVLHVSLFLLLYYNSNMEPPTQEPFNVAGISRAALEGITSSLPQPAVGYR